MLAVRGAILAAPLQLVDMINDRSAEADQPARPCGLFGAVETRSPPGVHRRTVSTGMGTSTPGRKSAL
jgi:hypothetical protein